MWDLLCPYKERKRAGYDKFFRDDYYVNKGGILKQLQALANELFDNDIAKHISPKTKYSHAVTKAVYT